MSSTRCSVLDIQMIPQTIWPPLKTYYPTKEAAVALNVLDVLSRETKPVPWRELANSSKHVAPVEDELILEVLTWLAKDHYIRRNQAGEYAFRYPIVKRWWKL